MKRAIIPLLTALVVAFTVIAMPAQSQSQSLDELRKSGAIGERFDGYVVVRESASGAAAVVAKVNAERQRIYEQRAKQQNISPAQVGLVYAQQIVGSAPAGTWFLDQSGNWRQK